MSAFIFSPFVDIKVIDPKGAADFYATHFGWEKKSSEGRDYSMVFGPLTIFLSKSLEKNISNIHFEMMTNENIEVVKERLLKAGCTVCKSQMVNSYMFTDPFGNNFHIYQK